VENKGAAQAAAPNQKEGGEIIMGTNGLIQKCSKCKYWIRFESGCFYGTCLKRVQAHLNATTFEGHSCEMFEEREQTREQTEED